MNMNHSFLSLTVAQGDGEEDWGVVYPSAHLPPPDGELFSFFRNPERMYTSHIMSQERKYPPPVYHHLWKLSKNAITVVTVSITLESILF